MVGEFFFKGADCVACVASRLSLFVTGDKSVPLVSSKLDGADERTGGFGTGLVAVGGFTGGPNKLHLQPKVPSGF